MSIGPIGPIGPISPSENIEIKARCADLRKAARIARRLGARRLAIERQRDTYFVLPRRRVRQGARLKLRERWQAIAGKIPKRITAQLIPYLRPSAAAPKRSRYAVIPVEGEHSLRKLLAGVLGVAAVIVKRRAIYLLENVRIHLDRVKGLGSFIEFEAVVGKGRNARAHCKARVKSLLSDFGIRPCDLMTASYAEMTSRG